MQNTLVKDQTRVAFRFTRLNFFCNLPMQSASPNRRRTQHDLAIAPAGNYEHGSTSDSDAFYSFLAALIQAAALGSRKVMVPNNFCARLCQFKRRCAALNFFFLLGWSS